MLANRIAAIVAYFNWTPPEPSSIKRDKKTFTLPGFASPTSLQPSPTATGEVTAAAPVIDSETLSWAIGYVLRTTGEFLTGFDRNEFGATMGNAEIAVMDAIRDLLKLPEWQKLGAVSKTALGKMVRGRAPFRGSKDGWRDSNTVIKDMLDEGVLSEVVVKDQVGRFYAPTAHNAWRSGK